MKITKSVKLTAQDLLELVITKFGTDLKIKRFEIKATGDYDRGNYEQELISITFENEEEI